MDSTALRCRWVSVLQLQCAGGIKVIKRYTLEHIPMLGFRDSLNAVLYCLAVIPNLSKRTQERRVHPQHSVYGL